ncbi:hypothetical protein AB433_06525 [Croceicoccus naphthovorans]|uniref:Uncharacterized protein n=1 Tax=Croceicoccus naphthovorans TaxID=1348774 RepID=A0A0G3XGF2_9SPHN|nr:hypothetical protein AB433_06525 [Croceicoccus naphthovorans]
MPDPTVQALAHIADRMLRDMGDHSIAQRMQGEVSRLRDSAATLDDLRKTRSPYDTPSAHVMKIGKASKKFDSEITAMIQRATDLYRAGTRDIEARIAAKVNLKQNEYAQEVRARFFGMDGKARAAFIKDMVDNNDGPLLAAIVEASPTLSGITAEQSAAYKKMILSRHAGAEIDEQARLDEVLDAVSTASRSAGNFAKGLTDPRQLARIEREAAEADAANEAFNQAMQSESGI